MEELHSKRYTKGWYDIDSDTLDSYCGSLLTRPDYSEIALRRRLLARQCICEGIIQERLAKARWMHQQQHPKSLLVPGMSVDIWGSPTRKDQVGWHGPTDLLTVERRAGSAVVQHQGQPLLAPLNHLRKHTFLSFMFYLMPTLS